MKPSDETAIEHQEIDNWLTKSLFDQVPMNICVIDRQFRIVKANKQFRNSVAGRLC